MGDLLNAILLGVSAVLIILLLTFFVKRHRGTLFSESNPAQKNPTKKSTNVACPLCKSILLQGEDIVSRVYRPMNVPDQFCAVYGCPHCYPILQPGIKRICPVCHKEVPLKNGYLTARLFNKSTGKKHVVVTGCTECGKHK